MDEIDVRIVRDFTLRGERFSSLPDQRPSPSQVGRRLDLDEKTVRSRIRRMEREGFIKYYQAAPALSLFGLESTGTYRFEAVNLATKRALVETVHGLDLVVEAADFLGPFVTVEFAGGSDAETRDAADDLARRFELTVHPLGTGRLPPPPMELDLLDWRLVQSLRYDARRSTRDLARATSVTPRMAGYRCARLQNSGALGIRAVLDSQRQQGLVFYEIELSCDASSQGSVEEALRSRHGSRIWSVHHPSPQTVLANLFAFTLAEPEEVTLGALELEGVRHTSLYVQKEAIEPRRPNWLDRRVALGIEHKEKGRTGSKLSARTVRRS